MKIFLSFDAENKIIYAAGHGDLNADDEGSPTFRTTINIGDQFMGLEFDELIHCLWLETDDAGYLIGKGDSHARNLNPLKMASTMLERIK